MNFGKVGFDPGHFDGQNIGPNGYIEGNAMLRLGLKLRDKYGCFITRSDGEDVSNTACKTSEDKHTYLITYRLPGRWSYGYI